MADELRIGLRELLHKGLIDQDADFLKAGFEWQRMIMVHWFQCLKHDERTHGLLQRERATSKAKQRLPFTIVYRTECR